MVTGPIDTAQVTCGGVNYHIDANKCEGCKKEQKGIWKTSTVWSQVVTVSIVAPALTLAALGAITSPITLVGMVAGGVAIGYYAGTGYEDRDKFEEQQNTCRLHHNMQGLRPYGGTPDNESTSYYYRAVNKLPYEGDQVHPYLAFEELRRDVHGHNNESDIFENPLYQELKRSYETEVGSS